MTLCVVAPRQMFLVVMAFAALWTLGDAERASSNAASMGSELRTMAKLSELWKLRHFNNTATLDLFAPAGVGIQDLRHPPAGLRLSMEQNLTVEVARFFGLDMGKISAKLDQLNRSREKTKADRLAMKQREADNLANTGDGTSVYCGKHFARTCGACLRLGSKSSCKGDCEWAGEACVSKEGVARQRSSPAAKEAPRHISPRDASRPFWPAKTTKVVGAMNDVTKWLHQRSTSTCTRSRVLNCNCHNYTTETLGFNPFMGWAQSVQECRGMCASHFSNSCKHFHVMGNGACFWRGEDVKQQCVNFRGDGYIGPVSCHSRLSEPGEIGKYQMVFVGGPHFSGTSIMNKIIGQSDEATLMKDTGAVEDEGQHLQFGYPSASRTGSLSFGCKAIAWLNETSPWITPQTRASMLNSWGRHWNLSRPVLVEKSPPNLSHMRFLQKMFTAAKRTSFIITIRHPLGGLHGRIPAFGRFKVKSDSTRWTHTTAQAYLEYVVRKLQCYLDMHRRLQADAPHVKNLRVFQVEHFMDNIHTGISHLSEMLSLGDLQEHVSTEAVAPHRVKKGVKDLTNEEERYRMERGGNVLNQYREGVCSPLCNSFTCDEVLDMARSDPTLDLRGQRLSCGHLESFLDCDCRSCDCHATREETAAEARGREKESTFKSTVKQHPHHRFGLRKEKKKKLGGRQLNAAATKHDEKKTGEVDGTDPGSGRTLPQASFRGARARGWRPRPQEQGGWEGEDELDEEQEREELEHERGEREDTPLDELWGDHGTGGDGDDANEDSRSTAPRRRAFLWGGRAKFHLDPSLTWDWMTEWDVIMEHLFEPTGIKPDTLIMKADRTAVATWMFSNLFLRHGDLIRELEHLLGYNFAQPRLYTIPEHAWRVGPLGYLGQPVETVKAKMLPWQATIEADVARWREELRAKMEQQDWDGSLTAVETTQPEGAITTVIP